MKTKTYDVQIEAIVTKTIRVNAVDADAAHEMAHELFNVGDCENEERYEEHTLSIVEVSDEDKEIEDDWFLSDKSYEEYYSDEDRNEKPAWERGDR